MPQLSLRPPSHSFNMRLSQAIIVAGVLCGQGELSSLGGEANVG